MSRLVDIHALVDGLNERIAELALELFPAGYRDGREWRIGSLAGEVGQSLAIRIEGDKVGMWRDFAAGIGGDALDLVAMALHGGDKGAAIRWCKDWLGMAPADRGASPMRPERRRRDDRSMEDEAGRRDDARRIWLAAEVALKGTPVDGYLKGRAIDLAVLGRQPRSLRFHPDLWNVETKMGWPAMVATITDGDGQAIAVHRTWLQAVPSREGAPNTTYTVTKAPLKNPKMVLGGYRGGAIRLWRGASAKPLRDAPAGETVVIVEGIEDGLSIAVSCPELRVLAAISVDNMANVVLPPAVTTVILCRDNDAPGSTARGAFDRAVATHLKAGRIVKVARSPIGKDFNDCLRGRALGSRDGAPSGAVAS